MIEKQLDKKPSKTYVMYLALVAATPGISRTELQKYLGKTSSMLALLKQEFDHDEVTNAFTKDGYPTTTTIKRGIFEEYPDRLEPRRNLVRLTPKGKELVDKINKIIIEGKEV